MMVRGTTAGTPFGAKLTVLGWAALALLAPVAVSACTSCSARGRSWPAPEGWRTAGGSAGAADATTRLTLASPRLGSRERPAEGEPMGPGDEGRVPGLWAPQRRALTTGLVLTITFIASEALAVVTVMPVVARDLGGLRLYGWVFSAFMLGSVVGIVAAGREADRRGPAVPFVAGVVLFGSGLDVAALAPSMGVLVAGRVLQGLGAGGVPSVAYAPS